MFFKWLSNNLCHDLCTAAEAECGPFYNVIDSEIATLTCDRAFYTPGSNGTCVNNLQLDSSAQETPFNPLQFFNDNAPNRDIAIDSIYQFLIQLQQHYLQSFLMVMMIIKFLLSISLFFHLKSLKNKFEYILYSFIKNW